MAVTNGYTDVATVKDAVTTIGQTQSGDLDLQIAAAINAASRQIDGYTGRRFWQDGSVVDRVYWADSHTECLVDDISTLTGLVVKTDTDDDGTYETTLTISTHFIVLPPNAADRVPVWPYTALRLVDSSGGSQFPCSHSGRPGVQVTARFGWPAIPDDVAKACVIQATQLFKSNSAIFGGVSFGDSGFMRVRDSLNPMAASLLEPYRRGLVA